MDRLDFEKIARELSGRFCDKDEWCWTGGCLCRDAIATALRQLHDDTLERAAVVAARDVDWTTFGKKDIVPWENGGRG